MSSTFLEMIKSSEFFELTMMLCFGCSWPFAILKTIRVKNPTGKSYLFMILVIICYLAGCVNKILHDRDFVLWFYLLNTLLVATDLVLCLYYQNRLNRAAKNQLETK